MKRLVLGMLALVLISGLAFAQEEDDTEVSAKKDVGITKVYSPRSVPEDAYNYFDDQLISTFSDMARFNVIGYQFRLDQQAATKMIEKIQELKQQEVMSDEEYMDEDLGIVVLSTEQLESLVNAFFVIIPELDQWNITVEKKEVEVMENGVIRKKMQEVYTSTLTIQVKIITSDGDLMETYTASAEETSTESREAAWKASILDAISGLELWLRQTDEFKLKTAIRGVLGGGLVMIELGKDLGVEPGYEFIMQDEIELSGGFSTKIDNGLIRVKTVYDNASEAKVLWGNAVVDQQLVESALAGIRTALYGGVMLVSTPIETITLVDGANQWAVTNSAAGMGIDIGLAGASEMGYAGLAKAAIGALIAGPLSVYVDLGYGYEMYFGNKVSIAPEFLLSGMISLQKIGSVTGYSFTGHSYVSSADLNFTAYYLGAKVKLPLNIQFNQNFKFSVFGGYSLYLPLATSIMVSPAGDAESFMLDSTEYDNLYVNGGDIGLFHGINVGAEFMFRF